MKLNNNNHNLTFYLLIVPVLTWLLFMIVIPHAELLISSFQIEDDMGGMVFSMNNYIEFFTQKIYWLTFVKTATYSIVVTLLAFIVAFPVAFYLTKVASKRSASFLMLLLLIPLWVGELVTVYGWMVLLGDHGVINHLLMTIGVINTPLNLLYTDFSMVVGLLYMSVLFMVIPIMSTLETLDDSLIEAACDLGATKWAIFTRIIIPYSMPGIVTGSIIVFMLVIGDYLAPNLLGGKSSLWFTEQIYNNFLTTFNWNEGAAFGFLLLMLSSGIIWIALKLSGQKLEKVGS
ncbi:spermidine/putrescine ABC transporter permease [Solemya pervernicosa gill symbiont]|uniref:Spermidine/putrescine ABC transporter permease n=2 Tax=Solemya pervernicosa gill symbiont TaxID=642797 RepID=A0A1T2KYZ6_9GAMM|nr:spermidine/putrescine ABC transporter permease [Solemya pervernicosa gill symbiont]